MLIPQRNVDLQNDERVVAARQMLENVLAEHKDDEESSQLAKIVQQLYALASARQKEQDQMIGGKLSPAAVRRAGA